ncbi:MAG: regulator [Gammaproteobacteria bacterium]|nr:regulator [Gammaproteobacteria bacterium]
MLASCSEQNSEPPATAQQQATTTQPTSVAQVKNPAESSANKQIKAHNFRVLDAFDVGKEVYVRALNVDEKRKRLWVGSSVGVIEVDLKDQNVLNTFTREHGLANEYVFSILTDNSGATWFGTNGGGMSRYRDDKWKTYFPMHGLADYWVYAFAQQSDNTLWVGTWAGASRLDGSSGELTNYVEELVNEWVYGIAVDAQERVWFATEGGVSMFDGMQWQAWTHADGLGADNRGSLPLSINTGLGTRSRHNLSVLTEGRPTYNPSYVFSIHHKADDGSIWAGTWGGGVSRFDGKQWQSFSSEDGLAGDIVFSIAEDRQGALWFGTNKGLSRFDGTSWITLDRSNGLLGESVYSVATTADGEIWAGTRSGVVRIGNTPQQADNKQ